MAMQTGSAPATPSRAKAVMARQVFALIAVNSA
jgi:hypothetical protein